MKTILWAAAVSLSLALALPVFAADDPSSDTTSAAKGKVTGPADAKDATASVKSGNLTASHFSLVRSGASIDIVGSIKNDGKTDEKVIAAGSTWDVSDIVEVTKKDGKEEETPLALVLPAGKTTDLSKNDIWLRVKDPKEPKGATSFPLILSFRSAPNANIAVALKGGDSVGDKVKSWLGQ